MLQTAEIISSRSELRRAVDTRCQIVSDAWDVPVEHSVRDLSEGGMWVECMYPLQVGEDIVVSLRPPAEERCDGEEAPDAEPIHMLGRVSRVHLGRRRFDPPGAGMGIEFLHVEECAADRLADSLRGIPPRVPKPSRKPTVRQELVWVEEATKPSGPISDDEVEALFASPIVLVEG